MPTPDETTLTDQQKAATLGGSTSPKTYTESDVKKAVNDALADYGRTEKQRIAEERKLLNQERDTWQREQDERERNAVKEDPAKLEAVTLRQQARDRQAQAERDKRDAEQYRAEAVALKIEALAEKNGVDPEELKRLSKGDIETAREFAKYLKPGQTTTTDTHNATTTAVRADSGVTSGGGNPKLADLLKVNTRNMNMKQLSEHKAAILAASKT